MELKGDYQAITDFDAEVLAVSMDELSGAEHAVKRLELPFPILYDAEGHVVRRFGVFDLLDDGLATPSTFLLDMEGRIQWRYIGRSIYDRPSNAQIIAELQKIQEG